MLEDQHIIANASSRGLYVSAGWAQILHAPFLKKSTFKALILKT